MSDAHHHSFNSETPLYNSAESAPSPESIRDIAAAPASEIISSSALMLMSAAAEKLGLSDPVPEDSPYFDLDEARKLITSLAGLVKNSLPFLGVHAAPFREGVKQLQLAFKEASVYPDEPGEGPGEKIR